LSYTPMVLEPARAELQRSGLFPRGH